jgi:RNA polymerase sigma factor (sigma-70 family)
MSRDTLDVLLDRLCRGDDAAAEAVFRAYEPVLRKVVRRQLLPRLRPKFDSADVVQSLWADLLGGFRRCGWHFASAEHLRAFLIRAVRNRFIDRCRQHRRALLHEQPLGDCDEELPLAPGAGPGDEAEADDLWRRLLALCPPEHHEVLRLRRLGLPPDEIAARTGLHPDSIRRIVRGLARKLALGQDG